MKIEEVDASNILVMQSDIEEMANLSDVSTSFDLHLSIAIGMLENSLKIFLTEKRITVNYSVTSLARSRQVEGYYINEIDSSKIDGEPLATGCTKKGDLMFLDVDSSEYSISDYVEVVYTTGYKEGELPKEIKAWLIKLVSAIYISRLDSDENFDSDRSSKNKINTVDDVLNRAAINLRNYRAPFYVG